MADEDDGRLIWYVAYGWKMNIERFHKYISVADDSREPDISRSSTWPGAQESVAREINCRLYFAGELEGLDGRSGAFVGCNPTDLYKTYVRQYLIRWDQFRWLYEQENQIGASLSFSFAEAVAGRVEGGDLPYGRILAIGDEKGIPRITLTANTPPGGYRAPDDEYLEDFVHGLRESHPELTDRQVLDYFTGVPGIGRPPLGGEDAEARIGRGRAWGTVSALVARTARPRTAVTIVGGGIAGLYCALQLAKRYGFEITVLEASPRFGGRIETRTMEDFAAEFGPMRFEPTIQPLLDHLVTEEFAGLGYDFFDSPSVDTGSARSGSSRYNLRHDELHHSMDLVDEPKPLMTTPLDLLRLGTIRMFRRSLWNYIEAHDLIPAGIANAGELDLCVDTIDAPPKGGGWSNQDFRPSEWEWTPAWRSKGVPDAGSPSTRIENQPQRRLLVQRWLDSLDDAGYDDLRRNAVHPWDSETFLRDKGFWNAMSEDLSPPAISFIRNEGTFYHLFPDNPNAVEWGIFWLRLLKTDANQLKRIIPGTESLVDELVKKLEGHTHVSLRLAQEVLELEQGMGARPLNLKVHDRRDGQTYTLETDHCVLALPLAPLRRLSSNFPSQIREDLSQVFGFALLKCILVVENPWWRNRMPPQSGAGGVPTRELHFQRDNMNGLVMLYTDLPASQFWRTFVTRPIHNSAEIGEGAGSFDRALVRHLLINARREAHRDMTALLLDKLAETAPSETATTEDEDAIRALVEALSGPWLADVARQAKLRDWYTRLISEPPTIMTVENFERILDLLRHPGFRTMVAPCDEVRIDAYRLLSELDKSMHRNVDLASVLVSVAFPKFPRNADDPFDSGEEIRIEKQVQRILDGGSKPRVLTWGVRDWSRPPVGAGCHAWSIGARSWEIMGRLDAFTLLGRGPDQPVRNVHICGEAVSDYQGFIEGALRSAERVTTAIVKVDAGQWAPPALQAPANSRAGSSWQWGGRSSD